MKHTSRCLLLAVVLLLTPQSGGVNAGFGRHSRVRGFDLVLQIQGLALRPAWTGRTPAPRRFLEPLGPWKRNHPSKPAPMGRWTRIVLWAADFPLQEVRGMLQRPGEIDRQAITGTLELWSGNLKRQPWRLPILSYLLAHPDREQYWRNLVYSGNINDQDVDLFFHVWAPQGQTRVHDHGARLAFVVALGEGLHAENFSIDLAEASGAKPGWPVALRHEPAEQVPGWRVSTIDPEERDIHVVSNESPQDRIVMELYVGPRKPMTTFIPEEGNPPSFVVNNIKDDAFNRQVGDVLLRQSTLLPPAEVPAAIEQIAPGNPAYTDEGTALVTPEHARQYWVKKHAHAYRSAKGPLVLRAAPVPVPLPGLGRRALLWKGVSA